LCCKVFGEIAGTHLESQTSHLVNAFHGQEGHLPMGTTVSVGVANETIVLFEDTFGYRFFCGAFFFAPANRNYFSH
jgi:hypothetical protein